MRAENSPRIERTAALAAAARARVDQVGDRFGLRNIHLAVAKGPFAELARPSHAAPELEHSPEHEIHDERAAMSLQLQDMLAGERSGRGEIQGEALIQAIALERRENLPAARGAAAA